MNKKAAILSAAVTSTILIIAGLLLFLAAYNPIGFLVVLGVMVVAALAVYLYIEFYKEFEKRLTK